MFRNVPGHKLDAWIPELNAVLSTYQINTRNRILMFLAQTGHETDRYNTFVEYTNPDGTNAWCHRYEGGCRYRGRGAIQLTHLSNYRRAGNELGADFVNNPDLVATNQYAFKTAGKYWQWRNLNEPSDRGDINDATRRINGGTNGLQDRINLYNAAKNCIGNPGPAPSPSPSPGCPRYYTVQPGDTLSAIAARFGTTVDAIVKANNIKNPNLIYVGQRLIIPC